MSAREFILQDMKAQLDFIAKRDAPNSPDVAAGMNESFQKELLDLISGGAQDIMLNETQRRYLGNVIGQSYKLEEPTNGGLNSWRDQEKLLIVASYMNSLGAEKR